VTPSPCAVEQESHVTTAGAAASRARARATAAAVPVSETLPWLLSALVVGLLLYYVIGIDEGAMSVFGDTTVLHEFVHDARHFLGFPCH
jgi:cobalt transporter subunit CbtB